MNLAVANPTFADNGIGIWVTLPLFVYDPIYFPLSTGRLPVCVYYWDGKTRWQGWWDQLAAIRRHSALSPYRTDATIKALLTKFAQLYNPLWLAERGAVADVEVFAKTEPWRRAHNTPG